MKTYREMNMNELMSEKEQLVKRLDEYKAMNLTLDMTRGKPASNQLDLSNDMYDNLGDNDFKASNGGDIRNYGIPAGIPEARETFAQILGTDKENIYLGNSSSLNLMFDTLSRAMIFGEHDSDAPWSSKITKKWLCPVPGYDRHFKVTETLGFELINVPMTNVGPNMDLVEELVKDPDVLGIWCVPVYSNPDGITYSEETCRRLASMQTAAKDFRIFWDNAYVVHHLYDEEEKQEKVPDILGLCAEYGNPSRVYEFASTSKVTHAGGGLSCFACNADNMAFAKKILGVQTINTNKITQYVTARKLPDMAAVKAQMSKHAAILRPKFELTCQILEEELADKGDIVNWKNPNGGYFISVFVFPGTADQVVKMCKETGVAFTPAGATYPYGKDPYNSNIRLAPSCPTIEDIEKAVRVLCVCAKITAIDKMLEAFS